MSLRSPTGRVVCERYRLIEELGRGGMGVVWRADDERLQRHVAVKEVHLPEAIPAEERDSARARALREARAAARLSHPSAVTIYDVQQEEGRAYLVMELVDAPSLADVLRESGPLDHERAAHIGLDILAALEAAHAAGIVHRDVKPANVMVPSHGPAKLADFGIASLKDDPKITQTGLILGSPSYMAPEQADGRGGGPRSDLWALGATLYYAVEGAPPFDEGQAIPTLAAVMHDEPRPLGSAGPLEPVVSALLSKDPAARPSHIETRRMLETAARGQSSPLPAHATALETEAPAPQPAPARAAPGSRWVPVVALVALLLLAGAGLAWFASRDGGSEPETTRERAGSQGAQEDSSGPGSDSGEDAGEPDSSGPGSGATVPEGWTLYEEPTTGHSIAYPETWEITPDPIGDGTSTDFRDPASGAYLRLDWTSPPGPSAVGAWEEQEQSFSADHAGYQRLVLEATTFQGFEAATWEFTWEEGGTTLHAVDLGFIVGDDYGYALNFVAPDDQWDDFQDEFATFQETFTPPS